VEKGVGVSRWGRGSCLWRGGCSGESLTFSPHPRLHRQGIDFTNMFLFVLLGSWSAKAACKMLVKSTLGRGQGEVENFISDHLVSFQPEIYFRFVCSLGAIRIIRDTPRIGTVSPNMTDER